MLSNRTTRLIFFATMLLTGLVFVALIMTSFEREGNTIASELLGTVILILLVIGAASVAALGLDRMRQRREKQDRNSRDEDD